ncbi:MAG: sodium/proton-translocating pyrophosphatase, partial [candidate division NC10 bacterium]
MPWLPLAPALGILGLLMAFGLYRYVVAQPAGSGLMVEISDAIETGAMTFLKKEYRILVWFIVVVAILLALGISRFTALAFVSGALCSMLAGFIGMKAAT